MEWQNQPGLPSIKDADTIVHWAEIVLRLAAGNRHGVHTTRSSHRTGIH
jgi:hypothetical protein